MGEISAPAYMVGKNVRDYFQKPSMPYNDPNDSTKAEEQSARDAEAAKNATSTK
jgi:hypothetical protein